VEKWPVGGTLLTVAIGTFKLLLEVHDCEVAVPEIEYDLGVRT
jgi:hypothetical protein